MAILLDSNIIIYSYQEEYSYLRKLFSDKTICTSAISRVEVLGYHRLKYEEEKYLSDIFTFIKIIDTSKEIFDKAIELRKQFNLKLGDSIVAATGLTHELTLYTRNLDDFVKIKGLSCINPVH